MDLDDLDWGDWFFIFFFGLFVVLIIYQTWTINSLTKQRLLPGVKDAEKTYLVISWLAIIFIVLSFIFSGVVRGGSETYPISRTFAWLGLFFIIFSLLYGIYLAELLSEDSDWKKTVYKTMVFSKMREVNSNQIVI